MSNNNNPLVSISCITYNHAPFIQQCLDGFLMQKTNFPIEVLIHDDASNDGTEEIIREYEARYPEIIKPLYEKENQWIKGRRGSKEFNYPRARGKYIAICEGDDYWTDPFKLQKQVDFLETHIEYGLVHTKYEILKEGKKKIRELNTFDSLMSDFENYLYTGDIRTLTTLFRTEFLDEIFNLLNHPGMLKAPISDRAIFLLIATKTKIHYINEVTGVYRILNNSASNFNTAFQYLEFQKKVILINFFLIEYLQIKNEKYFNHLGRRLNLFNISIYFLKLNLPTLLIEVFKKTIRYGWSFKEFKEFLALTRLVKS